MTNEELVFAIQSGTGNRQELLEQLYCANYGMISKICRRYSAIEDREDLLQESYFGLCKAAEMWRPDGGASFIGYAIPWIRQSILRYIENCGSCIRVPVNRRLLIAKYNKVLNDYRMQFGQDPPEEEMCILLNLSNDQLNDLKRDINTLRIRSLSEPIGEDGDNTLEDMIQDDSGDQYEELVDRVQNEELSTALWGEVDKLSSNEAAVLRDRYQKGHTFKECAAALGCSHQYAKAIHDKAIRALRRGDHLKRLRPFLTDSEAYSSGLKGTGYSSFMMYGSSQEYAVMRLEKLTKMSLYNGKEMFI